MAAVSSGFRALPFIPLCAKTLLTHTTPEPCGSLRAQDFVLPEELRGRNSMQTSRSGEKTSRACSSIIDLDDDFVRDAARDAGLHMSPQGGPSRTPPARLPSGPGALNTTAKGGSLQERRVPLARIDSTHVSAELDAALSGSVPAGDHARKGCGCSIC